MCFNSSLAFNSRRQLSGRYKEAAALRISSVLHLQTVGRLLVSINSQGDWNYGGGRLEGNWEALGSVYPVSTSFCSRLECSPGVQLSEQVRTVSVGGDGGDKEPHPESELGICWALMGGKGH